MSTEKRILVTGASGFIGLNLIKQLVSQKHAVSCLVRDSSNVSELKQLGCQLLIGDVAQDTNLEQAVADQDIVFHLAAKRKVLFGDQMMKTNVGGTRNLLSAIARLASPPVTIVVSSLAASGPSSKSQPRTELDPCRPISNYGISKSEAEKVVREFSDRIPVSIVRPPIVLGPGDKTGLEFFKFTSSMGLNVIAGFFDHRFSIIHVSDLVDALIKVADAGQRVHPEELGSGIYFVSDPETPTYRELGNLVGRAVGRRRVFPIRVARPVVWLVGEINTLVGRWKRTPVFFDRDKAKEANAGSWTCSSEKISAQLKFSPAYPLAERLAQTAQWYHDQGWLRLRKQKSKNQFSVPPHKREPQV